MFWFKVDPFFVCLYEQSKTVCFLSDLGDEMRELRGVRLDNIHTYVNFHWYKENKRITNDGEPLDVFVEYDRKRLQEVFFLVVYKPSTTKQD